MPSGPVGALNDNDNEDEVSGVKQGSGSYQLVLGGGGGMLSFREKEAGP